MGPIISFQFINPAPEKTRQVLEDDRGLLQTSTVQWPQLTAVPAVLSLLEHVNKAATT